MPDKNYFHFLPTCLCSPEGNWVSGDAGWLQFFSSVGLSALNFLKMEVAMEPEILCQTLKIAPGIVANG